MAAAVISISPSAAWLAAASSTAMTAICAFGLASMALMTMRWAIDPAPKYTAASLSLNTSTIVSAGVMPVARRWP
ncbi:hypothetical protein D3C71_1915390 [compost metagenome]